MGDDSLLPQPIQAFVDTCRCKLCGQEMIARDMMDEPPDDGSCWLTIDCPTNHHYFSITWVLASKHEIINECFFLGKGNYEFDVSYDELMEGQEVDILIWDSGGDKVSWSASLDKFRDLISKERVNEQELIDRIEAVRLLQ